MNAELVSHERGKSNAYSLSPSSLINIPAKKKLVLPSPNGSALSLAAGNIITLCASLRNCKAVADYAMNNGKKISVIPAGEKWEDGSIRFAIEDLIGAGAVISFLHADMSDETEIALSTFKNCENKLLEVISESLSGKELIERGFENDIVLASELNVSNSVPVLKDRAYINIRYH